MLIEATYQKSPTMNRFHSKDNENSVDYDPFAQTFAKSRKGKYWKEFEDIYSVVEKYSRPMVLDVGC